MEDCRITTSFYYDELHRFYLRDWKTAVLLLPSTVGRPRQFRGRLEDCRIITSFYFHPSGTCTVVIGRLPYLYFLLLRACWKCTLFDWKTAVFILPFTLPTLRPNTARLEDCRIYTSFYSHCPMHGRVEIGRLPYLYFLLLATYPRPSEQDWKTAVFILPFTVKRLVACSARLEDCRIYTSFYFRKLKAASYQRFFAIHRRRKESTDPVVRPSSAVFCR